MSEETQKEYKIGEKTYFQKKLVMGQVYQIMNLLQNVSIPADPTAMNLITALGGKLAEAIAIVLREPDILLKDKDVKQLAKDIEFEMEPEQALEVIEDFFDLTPISFLLERVGKTIEKIAEKMRMETGSTPS
jgi:hypothetical protein